MQYSHHIQYPSNWEQPAFTLGTLLHWPDTNTYERVTGVFYSTGKQEYPGWYYTRELSDGSISIHEEDLIECNSLVIH